jgi:hypothetical protein
MVPCTPRTKNATPPRFWVSRGEEGSRFGQAKRLQNLQFFFSLVMTQDIMVSQDRTVIRAVKTAIISIAVITAMKIYHILSILDIIVFHDYLLYIRNRNDSAIFLLT